MPIPDLILQFERSCRNVSESIKYGSNERHRIVEDKLMRAGRLEEACDLCRSTGQPWRAATLCPFGGLGLCPSVEALVKNGKNRTLQAIELESGIGHQWRHWKWATYCVSESACWAMAKSWLDVQVDLELARLQPGGMDQFKTYEDATDRSHGQGDSVSPSTVGLENWPLQVLNQQPRHLSALL
ncbi:Nuclear pore complex protein NUP107 [Camellia lanceoleosa]|uniref:Nuclear pore complex protein NUP107 n=1 Tax=Camellia lanceoleosa TaxID=1840588 RepID=A0ACC0IRB3_9ERIC|nr:Nuclear pore complex protein NUP107 [Camellia lanceoleosa]